MDIAICKKFATIYDSINKKLDTLKSEGDTLERALCQDNGLSIGTKYF
jgi:hypothetical protein